MAENTRIAILVRSHPVHLFVGTQSDALAATITALQNILCSSGGCTTCTICVQVATQQHPNCLWICPEKGYTTELLEEMFHTATFALGDTEYYFFILQKAETLNPTCAHSLLKLLEEPPHGYRFIMHTYNSAHIIPTIRSRSITTQVNTLSAQKQHHPLYHFFTAIATSDLLDVMATLQAHQISEHESPQLLDALITYWTQQLKDDYTNKKESHTTAAVLKQLTEALLILPMPGSSKLFWHNLFMHCKEAYALHT